MVGETHIKPSDGLHLQDSARSYLTEALACAILNIDPHNMFDRARPPHGHFGPWMVPFDQGMAPSYYDAAAATPFFFRKRNNTPRIPPLMNINIPRF